MLFADGSELEADEIVFATGYQNMRGTARKIFGDEVADQVKDVWGFDEEGELRTMWYVHSGLIPPCSVPNLESQNICREEIPEGLPGLCAQSSSVSHLSLAKFLGSMPPE